jgi:hypothetical protein
VKNWRRALRRREVVEDGIYLRQQGEDVCSVGWNSFVGLRDGTRGSAQMGAWRWKEDGGWERRRQTQRSRRDKSR